MPFELIGPLQQKKEKKKDQFLVHWGEGGGGRGHCYHTLHHPLLSNFNAKTQQKISLK